MEECLTWKIHGNGFHWTWKFWDSAKVVICWYAYFWPFSFAFFNITQQTLSSIKPSLLSLFSFSFESTHVTWMLRGNSIKWERKCNFFLRISRKYLKVLILWQFRRNLPITVISFSTWFCTVVNATKSASTNFFLTSN